jgi:hypothetical protein
MTELPSAAWKIWRAHSTDTVNVSSPWASVIKFLQKGSDARGAGAGLEKISVSPTGTSIELSKTKWCVCARPKSVVNGGCSIRIVMGNGICFGTTLRHADL